MRERKLSSRTVFEGQILTLRVDDVEAADGHRATREVIEHRGAVGVVVVHDGAVVLVRQHRYATGEDLLEIPAGKLDGDEDPAATAVREMAEEVNLRPVGDLEHLATYYTTPGFSDERFHLYLCDDVEVAEGRPDAGEVLEVERVAVADVPGLIDRGDVRDAKTLLGLLFLLRRT